MNDVSDESLPEWTEEELAVLRSVEDDCPPARSLSATLSAVGVGGALASGTVAAKGASIAANSAPAMTTAAKWTAFVAASKWMGIVALGGAAVTGSVVALRRAETAHRAVSTSVTAPVPTTAIAAPPPEPIVPEVSKATSGLEEPVSASSSARTAVRSQPDISLEIATLDDARTALRSGHAADALAALDRYDARFARAGSLRVEATALRIEALLRSGRRDRATALANVFLARNPKSPYAARVRALIGDNTAAQ